MSTNEAVALYKNKLTDNGIIAFHITNIYLDLRPVLFNSASAESSKFLSPLGNFKPIS